VHPPPTAGCSKSTRWQWQPLQRQRETHHGSRGSSSTAVWSGSRHFAVRLVLLQLLMLRV
jgi:hypothetical protein